MQRVTKDCKTCGEEFSTTEGYEECCYCWVRRLVPFSQYQKKGRFK